MNYGNICAYISYVICIRHIAHNHHHHHHTVTHRRHSCMQILQNEFHRSIGGWISLFLMWNGSSFMLSVCFFRFFFSSISKYFAMPCHAMFPKWIEIKISKLVCGDLFIYIISLNGNGGVYLYLLDPEKSYPQFSFRIRNVICVTPFDFWLTVD